MEATLTSTTHPTEFRHTPEAPDVPASHPSQRYFTQSAGLTNRPELMRHADEDCATLRVDVFRFDDLGRVSSRSDVRMYLSAADLLVLARACIDAAHDLDAHPAHALEAA